MTSRFREPSGTGNGRRGDGLIERMKIKTDNHTNDPSTPYGNRPMVTPIVQAVSYEYVDFEVLRRITEGEVDGYTYHRDHNPTVRKVEKDIASMYRVRCRRSTVE